MLKKPLIIGSRGNMGRRYGAILASLGVSYKGIDVGESLPEDFDSVIIATPTLDHVPRIREMMELYPELPILSEKPISTFPKEVCELVEDCRKQRTALRMVNQYKYMCSLATNGPSLYDYWNHGKDGLAWDCINIIGLASRSVTLGERSPIWKCSLNGVALDISEMDWAYILMIKSWLSSGQEDLDYIFQAHRKVEEFLCHKLS